LEDILIEVLRFIDSNKHRAGNKSYEHTASYSEISRFLFTYLKFDKPDEFKNIVSQTIELALKPKYIVSRYGNLTFQYDESKKWRDHFENLKRKDTSQITLNDLEYKPYTQSSASRLFRTYSQGMIKRLIDLGALQVTPGYRQKCISVAKEYLREA